MVHCHTAKMIAAWIHAKLAVVTQYMAIVSTRSLLSKLSLLHTSWDTESDDCHDVDANKQKHNEHSTRFGLHWIGNVWISCQVRTKNAYVPFVVNNTTRQKTNNTHQAMNTMMQ